MYTNICTTIPEDAENPCVFYYGDDCCVCRWSVSAPPLLVTFILLMLCAHAYRYSRFSFRSFSTRQTRHHNIVYSLCRPVTRYNIHMYIQATRTWGRATTQKRGSWPLGKNRSFFQKKGTNRERGLEILRCITRSPAKKKGGPPPDRADGRSIQ